VETHAYTQTGQVDSKFGMDFHEAASAVELCQAQGMPLTGLHFHQGSHFHDPAPLAPALQQVFEFIASQRQRCGWLPEALCPGGGWGVAYHEDDLPQPSVNDYVRFIVANIAAACQERKLPLPRLQLEPGRSLVARAGISVYQVGTVKQTPNRRWILLDGGMADNPRPALYGARYSALPVSQPERPASGPAWLGGPYCESGDVLIEALPLPALQPGELVAIPASGAYHLSMGSNYNGALKPAVVWLDSGQAYLIQSRQTIQDLLQRDLPLPGF
jgi:diaminopimelate decarboxylase